MQLAPKRAWCGSLWQSVHCWKASPFHFGKRVGFTGGVTVAGTPAATCCCGKWHFAQSTRACRPVSGKAVRACSNPRAGFHPASEWQRWQSAPSCPVLVEVAGAARLRLAQERLAPGLLRQHCHHGGVGDPAGVVALGAVEVAVLASEVEPGARVVEALLAALPPVDERLVPALVLVVAGLALELRGREPAMEPALLLDPRLELGVALQAALGGELLPGHVALRAVLEPALQRLVRTAQLARGEHVRRPGGKRPQHRGEGRDQPETALHAWFHRSHP